MGETGAGQPLPRDTRAFMESRMGADFGDVRLHTGGKAERLNQDIGAQAFTHGQDIYLAEGAADPASARSKHLLAHELTHTLQQGGVRRVQRHRKGRELKHAKEQAAEIERKERQTHDDNLEPEASAPIDPERGERGAPPKIGEDGFMTPAKVRAPWKEKVDTKAATKAAGRFKETQKLTPGAMSLASAQKILQGVPGWRQDPGLRLGRCRVCERGDHSGHGHRARDPA